MDAAPPPAARHLDDSPTGQPENRSVTLDDVVIVIDGLWAVTQDLNNAVRSYHRHLDEAVSKYDRGPLSADADLIGWDAGVVQAAVRKALAARGLAAAQREPAYQPGFLRDLKEIQNLILAARQRIDGSDAVNRWLLVVSTGELNSGEAGAKKLKHAQLKKARDAAQLAATKAFADLPIPLPEESPAKEETLDQAFSGRHRADDGAVAPREKSGTFTTTALPLHWEQGKRTTLINNPGYRLALTERGSTDPKRAATVLPGGMGPAWESRSANGAARGSGYFHRSACPGQTLSAARVLRKPG